MCDMMPRWPLISILLLLASPALAGGPGRTVSVLHFGSLDGAFATVDCESPGQGQVNFANFLSTVHQLSKDRDTVVLSSGNVIGDAPFFDFLLRQGESGIASFGAMLRASGVAVLVPGVGEFQVPYRMFQEFLPDFEAAGVRYRAANASGTGATPEVGNLLAGEAVQIHRFGAIKVAVIPVVGPEIAKVVHPDNMAGIGVADPVARASELAQLARQDGAHAVVVLANLEANPGETGVTIDFARRVVGVDLILAGGLVGAGQTEPVIPFARIGPAQVRLVGSPRAPDAVGVVNLKFESRGKRWFLSGVHSESHPVGSFRRHEQIGELLDQGRAEFCSIGQRILGNRRAAEPLDMATLLQYVMEVVRRELLTDLSVLSSDSLRGGHSARLEGAVTAGFLTRVFSRHEVVVLSVLGQDLTPFIATYFSPTGEAQRADLAMVGARRLEDGTIEINDRPIHPRRRYTMATSDFLASGGKGYLAALVRAPGTRSEATRFFLREMVHRYFARPGPATTIALDQDFKALWDRPLWELGLTANGAISNVSIANPGEYAETQLTSRSPNTGVKGDAQLLAVMSTRDHKVSEFLKAQYGVIRIGDGGFDETQDLVNQELQYSWTGWRNRSGKGRFWIPAPLARGKLETEFSPAPEVLLLDDQGDVVTGPDGTAQAAFTPYHHLEVTAVAGLEWLFGSRASAGLGYGVRSELLATAGSNLQGWHPGVEFYYQINKLPLYTWGSVSGITLDSRFELFYSDWAKEQTLKSSGSTKLAASVVGPLSFTLGFDFFLYQSGSSGVAYAFDTMAGLSFSYDAAIQQF
jgi:2',3'-cyclic-nucleotide 2'-phosphodiesterase (5'-nucleotidase family)